MSDEQHAPPMATPRVAAGALFLDDEDRILLVKPTYKDGWDIPGGYVEPAETPLGALRREVTEELGLDVEIGRLLVVDWAPHPEEGDKVLLVFLGPPLDSRGIRLDGSELSDFSYFKHHHLDQVMPGRLARRLGLAMKARQRFACIYAEDGTEVTTSTGAP